MAEIEPNLKNYQQTYKDFSWDNWLSEFSFKDSGKVNYAYEVTDFQVQKGNGDKPAIVTQKADGSVAQITFSELAEKTNILAANLKARGLQAGERFRLLSQKSID